MLQSQPPSSLVRREVDWAPLSRGTVNHLPAVVTTVVVVGLEVVEVAEVLHAGAETDRCQ